MKSITAEIGMDLPDYVTNQDLYKALDAAAEQLEETSHVSVTDMAVYGLDYDEMKENASDDGN